MYLTDLHMHTFCSPDGAYSLADMSAAAVAAGLSEICMTDHCDLMDLEGRFVPSFDWTPLEEEFDRTEQTAGLKIRFGIELGEAQEDFDVAEGILQNAKLDFVIGSLHNLSRAAGGTDFHLKRYTSKEMCHQDLDDYFSQMYLLAKRGCFDVLGHIPYPLRYMRNRDGQKVTLDRYWDQIAEIFRTVIQNGKGIELNTNRGRSLEEWMPILRLYKDLGGEIVTVGADAHRPDHVGLGIQDAYALLEAMKFRYVASYEKRKPHFFQVNQ
ncbi:MAG: histidinol-phosphatase HisJ family protein [Oscillospiraceae bacterium]|jgi:histidinol-phosphatase (PHP family)